MLLLALSLSCVPKPTETAALPALDLCDAFAAQLGEERSVRAIGDKLPKTPAVPVAYEGLARFSERTGWLLYAEDRAAARAQELLTPALRVDDRVSPSWVILPEDGALTVHFVGEIDGGLRSLYRAHYDPVDERLLSIDPPPEVLAEGPAVPEALPLEGERMYKALLVASVADFELYANGVRAVVVPMQTDSGGGWMVYFLGTHPAPEVVLLGGHVAVWVDIEGERVLQVTPHSTEAVVAERPMGPDLLRVEHSVTEWPVETHVYTSLRYDLPLCVKTEAGWWGVVGSAVRWLG